MKCNECRHFIKTIYIEDEENTLYSCYCNDGKLIEHSDKCNNFKITTGKKKRRREEEND